MYISDITILMDGKIKADDFVLIERYIRKLVKPRATVTKWNYEIQ